jgi:hypothetical protein
MKSRFLLFILAAAMLAFSCEKVSQESESYTDRFELVAESNLYGGTYLNVVPNEPVSKERVEKEVVGYGWESVATYKLDKDKAVVAEYEIIKEGSYSSSDNNLDVDMFEITGFGQDCLVNYDPQSDVYELSNFIYDETTGKISLRCWHVAHNGKLIYLSDDVMVCVDSKDFGDSLQIYMVVFQKVSDTTLHDWRDQHPYELTWE